MNKPSGSWVAIPTPFNEDMSIDFGGFDTLVEFHLHHGTDMLFCMGSAGETTLLTLEERQAILRHMVKCCKGRIPVYFGATMPTTKATVEFAKFAETEGADGLIFPTPNYLLPPQSAVRAFLLEAMQSVSIPVGVYNNPSRTGIMLEPETLEFLADECQNFVVDKEAMPSVGQLVEVHKRLGDRVNVMTCDFPKYSILLPNLSLGGSGAGNIGGNVIPEEMAKMSRPWTSFELMTECRALYFNYYDLMKALYWFSNPIVIKAALGLMGLPGGGLRAPYQALEGKKLVELKELLERYGVIEKYGVH